MPKHDWPHYGKVATGQAPESGCSCGHGAPGTGWLVSSFCALSGAVGATNALNGDKVLPIERTRLSQGQSVRARVRYQMGSGLSSLHVQLSPV
jgi:hypothetical protein